MGGAPPPGVSGDCPKWLEQDYGGGESCSPLVSGNVGGAYQQGSCPGPTPTNLGCTPAEGQKTCIKQWDLEQGLPDPPAGTNVVVEKTPDGLEIHIPRFAPWFRFFLWFFILYFPLQALSICLLFQLSPGGSPGFMFTMMLSGINSAKILLVLEFFKILTVHTRVSIGYTNYLVECRIGSHIYARSGGEASNITAVQTTSECEIWEDRKVCSFGMYLRYSENDWMVKVISHFLDTAKDGPLKAPPAADPPPQAPTSICDHWI